MGLRVLPAPSPQAGQWLAAAALNAPWPTPTPGTVRRHCNVVGLDALRIGCMPRPSAMLITARKYSRVPCLVEQRNYCMQSCLAILGSSAQPAGETVACGLPGVSAAVCVVQPLIILINGCNYIPDNTTKPRRRAPPAICDKNEGAGCVGGGPRRHLGKTKEHVLICVLVAIAAQCFSPDGRNGGGPVCPRGAVRPVRRKR